MSAPYDYIGKQNYHIGVDIINIFTEKNHMKMVSGSGDDAVVYYLSPVSLAQLEI